MPDVFKAWDAATIDRLFLFRSASPSFNPVYDDVVVHLDITDSSRQQLDSFYLKRSDHTQVIRNLHAMEVHSQLYDIIFAAPSNPEEDRAMIEAVATAANVYFGMAFRLLKNNDLPKREIPFQTKHYLNSSQWHVQMEGDRHLFIEGSTPLLTFPELAAASKGLGFLNINPDPDGVFRRIPLLLKYENAFYPAISFRILCDYLHVPPEQIIVRPGKSITLQDAQRPYASESHDIIIPIDSRGNMIVNFAGSWERMKHYNYINVLKASQDQDILEMWGEELKGKIVVISDVMTGASDIGPVPTDSLFPLGGIHSNVINTVLTESFLYELTPKQIILLEILLLCILLILSTRFSSRLFSLGTILILIGYTIVVFLCFLYGNIILPTVRPYS